MLLRSFGALACRLRFHHWNGQSSVDAERHPWRPLIRTVIVVTCRRAGCSSKKVVAHRAWIGDTQRNVRAEIRRVRHGKA